MTERSSALAAALLAAGCASMYNTDLEPAAKMRPDLVATVTWPQPMRTHDRLAALLGPLGMEVQILPLATGISHKGSLELIDGSHPVADAYVTGEVDGKRVLSVATVMDAQDASDADTLADNLHDLRGRFEARYNLPYVGSLTPVPGPGGGPPVAGQYHSTRTGERGPTHVVGRSVATAFSTEALSRAGALAREAQRALPGDLVIHLELGGWARLHGSPDVRRMIALEGEQEVALRLARLPAGTSSRDRALAEQLLRTRDQLLTELFADLVDLDATVDLGSPAAVEATVVLRPRAGSALAARVAAMRPVTLDPSWIAPDPVLVAALDWNWGPLQQREREVTAWLAGGGTGAQPLQAQLLAEKQALAGPGFVAAYAPDGKLGLDTVFPLRPAADGDALLAAVEAGLRGQASQAMQALSSGEPRRDGLVAREGKRLRISTETAAAPTFDPRRPTGFSLVTVAREALVTVGGAEASQRLDALEQGPAPSPAAASLVELARGSDGFAFVDLIGFGLRFVAGPPEPGAERSLFSTIPGLSQQHLPLLATIKGGRELTVHLTIPRQALTEVLAFVAPFLGRGTLDRTFSEPMNR